MFGFIPPIEGVNASFNTIRLGKVWLTKLRVGQYAILMDQKTQMAFGLARVEGFDGGKLIDLCTAYGPQNHTQIGLDDWQGAGARLMTVIERIYGPHIAVPQKNAVVIHLKRID